jgi:predicted ester cyclase
MKPEGNAVLLGRLYDEVINGGKLAIMDELYAPSYVNHAAPFGLAGDLAGLKELFAMFARAFPDQHITADELFAVGDLVVGRWTLRATHRGPFAGVQATGRRIVMTGIDIERVVAGRIVEHWGGEDMLGLLQQIGAVPQLGAAGPIS